MAISVEGLLENLVKQTEEQNTQFVKETQLAALRHEEVVNRDIAQGRSDEIRDKFTAAQQGQEVQLTKLTQHQTLKTSKLSKNILDVEGKVVKAGEPNWDKTSTVMTKKDAENLRETQADIGLTSEKLATEQQSSLNTLAYVAEKTLSDQEYWTNYYKNETLKTDNNEKSDKGYKKREEKFREEAEKKRTDGMWQTLKKQKETFDVNRKNEAQVNNMLGAIKTDASLIFGSMGALTALPGVQSVMTASKFILSNIYLLLVNKLIPWLGKASSLIFKGLAKLGGLAAGTAAWQKMQLKFQAWRKANLGRAKVGQRLRLLRQGRDKKGGIFEGRPELGKGFAKAFTALAALMKPLKWIIGILNPFKKVMIIAVVALGGLFTLFKSAGGTKEGFFQKMRDYMAAIENFWSRKGGLKDMLKDIYNNILVPMWDVFVGDILPILGWIFERVVIPLGKAVWEIAKVLGDVVALLFKYYVWIYDKIFKPLLKAFGVLEDDPNKMSDAALRSEQAALQRDRDFAAKRKGKFGGRMRGGWDEGDTQELDRVNALITARGGTTGEDISGLNRDIKMINLPGLGEVPFQAALAHHQQINMGNKTIYSSTGTHDIPGSQYQGLKSIP
jgi:hypothetical protein